MKNHTSSSALVLTRPALILSKYSAARRREGAAELADMVDELVERYGAKRILHELDILGGLRRYRGVDELHRGLDRVLRQTYRVGVEKRRAA
jgi:hypothetical protein